jgi:hypothetical protein
MPRIFNRFMGRYLEIFLYLGQAGPGAAQAVDGGALEAGKDAEEGMEIVQLPKVTRDFDPVLHHRRPLPGMRPCHAQLFSEQNKKEDFLGG